MTRHWIEAYVDQDTVSFRCVCENTVTCTETAESCRGQSCAVMDWFAEVGTELFAYPADRQDLIGRIEVAAKWTGYGEDAELELLPPPVFGAGDHVEWNPTGIEWLPATVLKNTSPTPLRNNVYIRLDENEEVVLVNAVHLRRIGAS